MNKELMVKCPTCNKKFNYYSSGTRPFCTERCKMVDLGKWLNEEYNIPVASTEGSDEDDVENEINEDRE